jgi:hypothetical protein
VFGWNRREEDAPFYFQRTFGEFYDVGSPDVRRYDDVDAEQRVATSAAAYGAIREANFRDMLYAHHAVDDSPHVIAGDDRTGGGSSASTTRPRSCPLVSARG